jgi:hypothetical protein
MTCCQPIPSIVVVDPGSGCLTHLARRRGRQVTLPVLSEVGDDGAF